MHKLSDDRLDEIGSLLQRGEGMFADGIGKELLCLCLELRSLRSIMRSVESHDEYLRIQFAEVETNQMPLPGLEEIAANQPTVAEAMLAEANQTFYHEKRSAPIPIDPLCECGHTASDHVKHKEGKQILSSEDPKADGKQGWKKIGIVEIDNAVMVTWEREYYGPCRRTPCGVKCRCDAMTVKV